jgi:hypothetical protein
MACEIAGCKNLHDNSMIATEEGRKGRKRERGKGGKTEGGGREGRGRAGGSREKRD